LVLGELSKRMTDELEGLLQTRFGTGKQAVSFQAKLRARRRAEGEPVQDLYRDISRLVQLAHPTESSHFWAHVGIDAFVGALNDRELEFEVLKLEPKTLEDAVDHAVCLESLAESVNARTPASTDKASARTQNCQRTIFAVTDDKKANDEKADLLQRVAQLEQQLKQATQGVPATMLRALPKSLTLKGTEAGSLPTTTPQLRLRMAQNVLTLKRIRATTGTVMSMAIGVGTAPCASLERKLSSSPS